ncbi:hypothetical protein SAMN02745127_01117 [Oceanospirillum multiglobuliferum]|nr:hypothetical protein SAMN02745127_01117 [Oceanospirillum multiglobuliferum]
MEYIVKLTIVTLLMSHREIRRLFYAFFGMLLFYTFLFIFSTISSPLFASDDSRRLILGCKQLLAQCTDQSMIAL